MPAHRQSALLLHGLAQADQRWILARLDQADARVLRDHLRELKDLGIPADRSLAPVATPAGGASAGPAGGAEAALVQRASPAALQLALADEPAWVVAQLLALSAWPWRAAFLDGLAPERRAAIEACAPAALAPRAAAALLAAVAGALAAGPVQAHARPAAAVLDAARQTLRRWF